jgi:hypothetical protein
MDNKKANKARLDNRWGFLVSSMILTDANSTLLSTRHAAPAVAELRL